jgi:hypothetical protein
VTMIAKASEIPLERRYSLSPHGLALLRWIVYLHSNEYLLGMTPPLEDNLKGNIGIETELGESNVRVYIELLVEEINEKTDFVLRTVGWQYYSSEETRILVKKKEALLEGVVRAVQFLGLSRNRFLGADKVREAIRRLVGEI